MIIVTRPQPLADKSVSYFQGAGLQAVAQPLLSIQGLAASDNNAYQAAKQRVMALDEYQAIIFISQNAVVHGVDWVERYWPQWPVAQQFFTIGESTRARLLNEGIDSTCASAAMNTEELLQRPELQSLVHQKVLIVRGCGGRTLLAEQLRQRGAEVDYLEVYRRCQVAPEAEAWRCALTRNQCIITCLSAELVISLAQQLPVLSPSLQTIVQRTPMVVPSARVAAIASEHKFEQVYIAKNATDAEVLCCVQSLPVNVV